MHLKNALQARNKLITEYVKKNVELEHELKSSKSEVSKLVKCNIVHRVDGNRLQTCRRTRSEIQDCIARCMTFRRNNQRF